MSNMIDERASQANNEADEPGIMKSRYSRNGQY